VCEHAIAIGRKDIFQWGYKVEEDLKNPIYCRRAAERGDLRMLQWLRNDLNCPWDETTLAAAAMNGHDDVVYWAFENSAPFNEYSCASAARGGHLHILLWLSDNFCPCDHLSYIAARCYNHIGVLDCLTESLTKQVMNSMDIEVLFGSYDYKETCKTIKTSKDYIPIIKFRDTNEYTHVVVPDEAVIRNNDEAVRLIQLYNLITIPHFHRQEDETEEIETQE